ncbi:uncharacterized protein LOC126840200 [Adelges cooleyi]|uniref:uncharacterized protein LOC126840200 n=1 Tax=Adelges cooleyi TaxID=133065 RepID=UPI00217F3FD5|nr:uncharacterized protein LOC126840200 [Adelges cooleyi]
MTNIPVYIFMLLSSIFFTGVLLQVPYYAVHLIRVTSCAKNKQFLILDVHNNASTVNVHGSNQWTVYEEITEEKNITIQPSVFMKINNNWILQPVFSKNSINVCMLVKQDPTVVPTARLFVHIPYNCPIKKGVQLITKNRITSMIRPMLPFGCWMLKLEYFKPNGNNVGCITAIILQSININLESESKLCY